MFIVVVEFDIASEHLTSFMREMHENAHLSVEVEPECLQFDVCTDPAQPTNILLYEVYSTKSAFEEHLRTKHFLRFNETVAPWVRGKSVRTFLRTHPA